MTARVVTHNPHSDQNSKTAWVCASHHPPDFGRNDYPAAATPQAKDDDPMTTKANPAPTSPQGSPPISNDRPAIELHRVPGWFNRQYFDAVRAGRSKREPYPIGRSSLDAFMAVLNRDNDASRLFDHWGTTADGAFVSEPYAKAGDDWLVEAAKRFAATFSLDYEIGAESNWFPPFTVRVAFKPATKARPQDAA